GGVTWRGCVLQGLLVEVRPVKRLLHTCLVPADGGADLPAGRRHLHGQSAAAAQYGPAGTGCGAGRATLHPQPLRPLMPCPAARRWAALSRPRTSPRPLPNLARRRVRSLAFVNDPARPSGSIAVRGQTNRQRRLGLG